MALLDWLVIALFLPALMILARRWAPAPGYRAEDRFSGGRNVHWIALGGSIAATSLSTDTPLLVSGAFYRDGLHGNWFWLAGLPGVLATFFFFARYWRRSGVLTEVEIFALRYGDTPTTRRFRALNAFFEAGLINLLVISSVLFASSVIVEHVLGFSPEPVVRFGAVGVSGAAAATAALMAATASYTLFAGFRGVVRTDVAQLFAAVIASIVVAVFALAGGAEASGGLDAFWGSLPDRAELFSLFRFDDLSVLLFLVFRWWQTAPGGGLIVQRLVSARSEREAGLTVLLFTVVHYVLRAWPWFVIGAVALIWFPTLENDERAFGAVAAMALPAGGAGLLVVAFWSAFMSTVDSRLNWGASYFVNDLFGAFGGDRDSRTARRVEFSYVIAISAISIVLVLTGFFSSIMGIYKYLIIIQSGTGFAAIARWYWWRLTIRSEIVALSASVLFGNVLFLAMDVETSVGFAGAVALNSVVCAAVTAATAVWTSRDGPTEEARRFDRTVRVAAPGWRRLRAPRDPSVRARPFAVRIGLWLLATAAGYALIAFIGAAIGGAVRDALVALAAFLAALAVLFAARSSLRAALLADEDREDYE